MFKRILAILLCITTAIGCFYLAGCSSNKEPEVAGTAETPEQKIAQSTFLYPDTTDEFIYNRYTYYVTITRCLSTKGNIVIPDTISNLPVLIIAPGAFQNQTTITSVSFSDNIITIGDNAFSNCPNLETIKLPSGLVTLGTGAFAGCVSLKNIEIPNTIANIPGSAFSGCSALTSVIINEPTLLSTDPETGVETYTPPRTVSDGAFSNCANLKYIWFPADCTVGSGAISGSMQNLTIYGYSQSNAAVIAADCFVPFNLIQNKAQLAEFKSRAQQASMTQIVKQADVFKGTDIELQIENVYIIRNSINYETYFENKELKTTEASSFEYVPSANDVVAIFGIRIRNNTSRQLQFNELYSSIKVDSYVSRFSSFGVLKDNVLSKYSLPSYTVLPGDSTSYIYFASVIKNDWKEIELNFGNHNELVNCVFNIKNSDNITYVGSANSALENTPDPNTPLEQSTEPVEQAAEETSTQPAIEVVSESEQTSNISEVSTESATAA